MPGVFNDEAIAAGDLDAAVAGGVLSGEQRAALLDLARARRLADATADEERFRLVSSFNDIFVTLAIVVLLGGLIGSGVVWGSDGADWIITATFALVAALAWGLAEYFTRRRRMALPSITLLLAFVGAVFAAATGLAVDATPWGGFLKVGGSVALGGLAAAIAAWLHWRRFQVPITVAAGAAAIVALLYGALEAASPGQETLQLVLAALAGVAIFAAAMRFDTSDPARETRGSDVAFWLHLLAAPLIVHPLMVLLGLFGDDPSPAIAGVVLALYGVFTIIARIIDRRALLVSALGYVLYAINALLARGDDTDLQVPLTALVIGLFLVTLSAVWHRARGVLVGWLPVALAARLPRAAMG